MFLEGRNHVWSAKEELGGSSGIYSSSLFTLTMWHKTKRSLMCAFYRALGIKTGPPKFLTAMIGNRVSLWKKSIHKLQREHTYISGSVNSGISKEREQEIRLVGKKTTFEAKFCRVNPVVDLRGKKKILCPKIHISIYFMHSFMVLRVEW